MMNLLLTISQAYSLVVQQERLSSLPTSVDSFAFSFNSNNYSSPSKNNTPSQGRGRGSSNNRQPMLFTHCNWSDHTIETCYFKHRFPPGYHSKNSSNPTPIANVTTDQTSKHDNIANSLKQQTSSSSLPISREYFQYLITLLHSSKNDPGSSINSMSKPLPSDSNHHVVSGVTKTGISHSLNSICILDSEASDHICTNIHIFFTTYQKNKLVSIQLPNGILIFSHFSGTVYFQANLYLTDVFFNPWISLQFNLYP